MNFHMRAGIRWCDYNHYTAYKLITIYGFMILLYFIDNSVLMAASVVGDLRGYGYPCSALLVEYSTLPISRGHFSANNSR